MMGIFFLFKKILRIHQKAVGLVFGNESFADNSVLYCFFAFLMVQFK